MSICPHPYCCIAALICSLLLFLPLFLLLLSLLIVCHIKQSPAFLAANAGLAFDYQFIDVPDFQGRGETEPAPYYYQNLGEAE